MWYPFILSGDEIEDGKGFRGGEEGMSFTSEYSIKKRAESKGMKNCKDFSYPFRKYMEPNTLNITCHREIYGIRNPGS
jgi:hypothetical protein